MAALADSIAKLTELIGLSASFQTLVGASTAAEAEGRVHQVFAGTDMGVAVENIPRPFALIEIGDYAAEKIAENAWSGEGFLTLKIAADLANVNAPGASLIAFAEACVAVLTDMQELAGVDDNLNLRNIEQEDAPNWVPPEQGHETPWCWASWKLRWARF